MFRTTLTLAAILAAVNAAEFGAPRKGGYGGVEHGHGGPGHRGLGVGRLRGGRGLGIHGGHGGHGLDHGYGGHDHLGPKGHPHGGIGLGHDGHGIAHDGYGYGDHGLDHDLGHGALAHDGYALGHNGHVGLGDYGYGGHGTLAHGGHGLGHGLGGYGGRSHQILGKKGHGHKKSGGNDIQSRLSFFGDSRNTLGKGFGRGLGLGGVSGFGSDFFGHDF